MASRLTQEVLEVLSTTTPQARLTQLVVEVLSNPTAAPPTPLGVTQPHVCIVS